MYDCHDEEYDGFDIHALTNVGVNIFNIDMTQHDAEFFRIIKRAMEFSAKMPGMIPTAYYTPVGMCVTMSANNPIDVDDRISAGVVVDPSLSNIFCNFDMLLRKIREERKPIFFMNSTLVDNYYEQIASDRQLLIQVNDLIKNKIDGIFLKDDRHRKLSIECIQALVRAIEIIEKDDNAVIDYFKMSLPLKLPVLQPYAVALAASLAALQSGATAIIVFTTSGASAKLLSRASPPCRVLAVTRHEKTARRMHLYRKVMPLHYRENRLACWQDESLARIAFGTQFGVDTGLFNFAAKLVVLAPSAEGIVYCNSFQIHTVKHILNTFKCGKYIDGDDLV